MRRLSEIRITEDQWAATRTEPKARTKEQQDFIDGAFPPDRTKQTAEEEQAEEERRRRR